MIDLLFGSLLKKVAAGVIVLALLFGWFQVRGCIKNRERLWQYEQAEKIKARDRKTDKKTEDRKDEVDKYNSDTDLESGFDKLRDYKRK